MFSRATPSATSRLRQARAAAPGAGSHQLYLPQLLSRQFHGVEYSSGDDDGGAMLVVVEDRNAHAFLEAGLDLETFRTLDVLQVDAAECRLERCHHIAEELRVGGIDLDIEDIDAGEFLEQHRLSLHHRLGGFRADVAEAEHGGAVGDDGDEVGARRQGVDFLGVVGNNEAGGGNPRRIGKRQIALVGQRLGRLDLQLSRR